jgi:hypothetical protein
MRASQRLSIFDERPEGMDLVFVVRNAAETINCGWTGAKFVVTNLTERVAFEFALFWH